RGSSRSRRTWVRSSRPCCSSWPCSRPIGISSPRDRVPRREAGYHGGGQTERHGGHMENEGTPRDHAGTADDPHPYGDDTASHAELTENLKSRSTWLRLFFMLVFVFIYGLTRLVLGAVVVLQFFWVLFTAETNPRLKTLGASLATYTY